MKAVQFQGGNDMRRREVNRLLLACMAAPLDASTRCFAQTVHDPTPGELAASVKIVDSSRMPGDWCRYGADPTGHTDSTASIQGACNSNQLAFDSTGGIYLVSSKIIVPSNVTVRGAGSSVTTIACANGGTSVFASSGATGVIISHMKIAVTTVSREAHTGAVEFYRSTHCSCTECEITGCNWAGVLIRESARCSVDGCYFHDFQGGVQDSADVCIYDQSHHNTVTNNRCSGGNWHGVAIQDPYNNSHPSYNLVSGNSVTAHQAYGVMVYVPAPGDTFNEVRGNTIQDIQGSVLNHDAGAGIYVVGSGAGGTAIANNTVQNCCIQSIRKSLAPAGIGIAGIAASAAPVSVTGNTVLDIQSHDGILIVSSKGRISVAHNTVRLPAGNPAAPISVEASSNVEVTGNLASRDPSTPGRCIFIYANGAEVSNVSIVDNVLRGSSSYPQIEFLAAAGGSISDVTCAGNICHGSGPNPDCIRLVGVHGAQMSENKCLAG
jgi:hypothetical protein